MQQVQLESMKQIICSQFDSFYRNQWLVNTEDNNKAAILFSENEDICFPYFIVEIYYDKIMRHVSVVVKLKSGTATDSMDAIIQIMMDCVDSQKKEILEQEKRRRDVQMIRVVLEKLGVNCLFLTAIGTPIADLLKKTPEWIVNSTFGVACYGRFDVRVQLQFFHYGNLTDTPNETLKTTVFVFTDATIGDIRTKVLESGLIQQNYTVGSFFTKINGKETIYDDDSQTIDYILTPTDYSVENDIYCQVVYGEEVLM